MSEESKFIYDELKYEGYPLFINKRQYANIIGCSLSSVDHYIKQGTNLPDYKKLGTSKNAKVMFNLRDVAEYLAAQTVKTV